MRISKIINFFNEGALRGDYIIRGLNFIKPTLTLEWINLVDYLMFNNKAEVIDDIICGLEKYNNSGDIDYTLDEFVKNIILTYGFALESEFKGNVKVLK